MNRITKWILTRWANYALCRPYTPVCLIPYLVILQVHFSDSQVLWIKRATHEATHDLVSTNNHKPATYGLVYTTRYMLIINIFAVLLPSPCLLILSNNTLVYVLDYSFLIREKLKEIFFFLNGKARAIAGFLSQWLNRLYLISKRTIKPHTRGP